LKFKEIQEIISLPYFAATANQASILNEPITMSELNSSLQEIKSNNYGSDKIPFLFIQNLSTKGKLLLLELYNNVWLSGTIPKSWKNASITPVPKKEQEKHQPSGYHPISVLCNLSKTPKKIIYNRLNCYVQRFNLLSPNQHGFKKSHSTADSHVELKQKYLNRLPTNKPWYSLAL